jgi:K+-sensing histidine kinase KdpD
MDFVRVGGLNIHRKNARYLGAVLAIAAVTGALAPIQPRVSATTVALALLLAVLFTATLWGSGPALLASVLGMGCFNFFFLPPVGSFTIEDPQNWVALVAFFITAITVGQLSGRARRRAEQAEAGRREIERLYIELSSAFERASHAEALKQSEKLKSALLDAVTHDLRTPLTSIKAAVTALLDVLRVKRSDEDEIVLGPEARQEMLEIIDEESDRLTRFLEGMVELSRIEAGKMHLRQKWAGLDEIIATALLRARAITRNHRVEVAIEDDLPLARIDGNAVGEVIYTLVENAAKYSPEGSCIRVGAVLGEKDVVQIAVEDEGPGIPFDLRQRVFDKFFRAALEAEANGHRVTGTGMGLAIAKGIIEAHGGAIWIEDTDRAEGTRVVASVPIGDDEEAQIEQLLAGDAPILISG